MFVGPPPATVVMMPWPDAGAVTINNKMSLAQIFVGMAAS